MTKKDGSDYLSTVTSESRFVFLIDDIKRFLRGELCVSPRKRNAATAIERVSRVAVGTLPPSSDQYVHTNSAYMRLGHGQGQVVVGTFGHINVFS